MLFLKMFKSLHLFPILPAKSKEMSGGSFAHYCIFISCAISLPAYYDQTLNGVHYHECVLRSAACIRVRKCLSSSTNFPHHRDHYQTSVTPSPSPSEASWPRSAQHLYLLLLCSLRRIPCRKLQGSMCPEQWM